MLVPVKAFTAGKARLAPALDAGQRAALARAMAGQVLRAAAPLAVAVACDDEEVAAWAQALGAAVVWTPGLGLNGAVQKGCAELVGAGADHVIVAHADLPRATGLARLVTPEPVSSVVLVPDRRDDGTNVAVVSAPVLAAGFTFAYGVGSFARHLAEATRLGVAVHVVRIAELQWDVDTPDDLVEPQPATT